MRGLLFLNVGYVPQIILQTFSFASTEFDK